jgi:hypothetical protein
MEMIWHYDKLVKSILSFRPMLQQHFNEKCCHPLALQHALLTFTAKGDEVRFIWSGDTAIGNDHTGAKAPEL